MISHNKTERNNEQSSALNHTTFGFREHERHIARVCPRDLRHRGKRWADVSREMGKSCRYTDFDLFI